MELLDIIVSQLPLADPSKPGDKTLVVQDGVLKQMPPAKVLEQTFSSTPLVVDIVTAGLFGPFFMNLSVPAGTTIKIEVSRNSGSTYVQYGDAPWGQGEVPAYFTRAASDSSHVTTLRFTRMTGSGTGRVTLSNTIIAFTGAQQDMIGIIRSKPLVVDGTTRVGIVDPTNDRGFILQSFGVDNNIVQINAQATTPWDYSKGDVFFCVERKSNGNVSVNPAPSSAVVISNPTNLELVQDGPFLCYKSSEPNKWTVS